MFVVRGLDNRDEGDFVGRAAPRNAGLFATEIGIIHLDATGQLLPLIALAHGLHEFVLHRPGGVVAHAQLARQGHGGYAFLLLGQAIDGQKPLRHRQLGVGENVPAVTDA